MEAGLRSALDNSEFELFFQPILNAQTERLNRFEALIRWHHPERGIIAPSEFIPLAEEVGLIVPIGEWLITEVCRIAATWPERISVSVNISDTQPKNINLVETVGTALQATGLAANRLELEITESVLLENSSVALAPLHQLRELGSRISLDDFGTGFSSIGCLLSFPFDKIKIDQSFVRDLDSRPAASAVIHAIVDLGVALGMTVTAEGVETAAQLRLLRTEACSEVQGFLFSPPRPAEEVPELIEYFDVRHAPRTLVN
jgi:EAL domain-containing protein (putative c-di-GMP-specific phosphodiesterase class I)